jgi:hypothetical protein
MSAADLTTLLKVDSTDIAANRDGHLSEAQRDRLHGLRARTGWIGAGVVLLTTLAAALLLFFGEQQDSVVLRYVGIGVTLCNAAAVGLFARQWLRLSADLRGGQVASAAGSLRHTIRISGRVAVYIIEVDAVRFTVDKSIFFGFEEGRRYRLYWSPAARVLLAAEPL